MTVQPYQLCQFKKWLISTNGHSPSKADTTIEYLILVYNDYAHYLPESSAVEKLVFDMEEWGIQLEFLNVFEEIYQRIASTGFIERLPQFQRKRALSQYCDFLLYLINPYFNNRLDEVKPTTLYHSDLIEKFTKQLATADGIYGNVYFPISVIKRLFNYDANNKVFFDNALSSMVDKITMRTSNGSISLKELNALQIGKKGFVSVSCADNTTKYLFTYFRNRKKPVRVQANSIENLELRFTKPMRTIFKESPNLANMLAPLTREIIYYKNGPVVTKMELVHIAHELVNNGTINQNHIKDLRSALWLIADAVELEIMPTYEFGYRRPW